MSFFANLRTSWKTISTKKEEKKMDIKVGDTVKAVGGGVGYEKGKLYTVANTDSKYKTRFIDVIDQQTGKIGFGCYSFNFEKVELPKRQGKILIMVDEKDNNKIIARDLLTNKTAEAKCSQKDEWDFNKGAKLALERLTEPEKPKGWTGKVVLVEADCDTEFFTRGKVYKVENGYIIDNSGEPYEDSYVITSLDNLNEHFKDSWYINRKFIEYKGGADE